MEFSTSRKVEIDDVSKSPLFSSGANKNPQKSRKL